MINNSKFASMDKAHADDIRALIASILAEVKDYDAEKTQVLKNVNGELTWVTETSSN